MEESYSAEMMSKTPFKIKTKSKGYLGKKIDDILKIGESIMKLEKDTLIEGKIVKKDTVVRILEKVAPIDFRNLDAEIVGIDRDKNGNKVIKVKPYNQTAFSIQTNQNIPTAHKITKEDLKNLDKDVFRDIEKEVTDYVSNYGTAKQKKILGK